MNRKLNEITYFGNRVIAGGGCEAAATARTRCRWAKFKECSVSCCMAEGFL